MAIKGQRSSPTKLPGYVLYWTGKCVIAPSVPKPQHGRVTSVNRVRGVDGSVVYAHVVLDDGKMWIGEASALHIVSDRPAEPKVCDVIAEDDRFPLG